MEGIEIDETHPKTIIHIDIDCFYAQVEEIHNPELKTKPLGIQQKNCLVTANYVAREFGIKKLMMVSEAQKLCPELVLVNGEDLSKYREMSSKIFDVIRTYTTNVEKLGFDENYIDVSTLITERLEANNSCNFQLTVEGNILPDEKSLSMCCCGCDKRLILGSHLAKEIRQKLFDELNITSCAGIGHNKLLAKLVGAANKPNKQTTLAPSCATTFLTSLGSVRSIPSIGLKTENLLNEIAIETVQQLQDCDLDVLQKKFGYETACRLKDLSFGRDYTCVRPSGKPKTIGLEDSCRTISVRTEVEDKLRQLLIRLIKQIKEDGRIPIAIKIMLRKLDLQKKTSHRETKQCNIVPSLFKHLNDGKLKLIEGGQEKLLKIIMRLFDKTIDMKKPFNITLLGLAFSKFQERKTGASSIANFLIKKADIEVQSVTNLSNESSFNDSLNSSTVVAMEHEPISDTSLNSDSISETDIEPSPKKTRIGLLIAKRRFASHDPMDVASPSKLRVADLRLNSRDSDRDSPIFRPYPSTATNIISSSSSKMATTSEPDLLTSPSSSCSSNGCSSSSAVSKLSTTCPPGVDKSVFHELPIDVQKELMLSWHTPSSTTSKNNTSTPKAHSSTGNTLHRYFIKNN